MRQVGRRPIAALILAAIAGLPVVQSTQADPVPHTVRASTSSAGSQLAADSTASAISADGRYVAFVTAADLAEAGDSNGARDVYRKDLETGAVELVSVGTDGAGNGMSGTNGWIDISDDGTKIVFESFASDLVDGDGNESQDIFVRDMVAGTTVRANVGDVGDAPGGALGAAMSADGSRVAFVSYAGLTDGEFTAPSGAYVRDLSAGNTIFVAPAAGSAVALSGDGRTVAYMAAGSGYKLEKKNLDTGAVTVLNAELENDFSPIAGVAGPNGLDHDGSTALFMSDSAGLVAGDTNESRDVFAHVTDVVILVSADKGGRVGNAGSGYVLGGLAWGAIDASGRYAAFVTTATNLGGPAAIVKDIDFGAIDVASTTADGSPRTAPWVNMSSRGAHVTYSSFASDIVDGDTNEVSDVFRRTRSTALTPVELSLTVDQSSTLPGAGMVDPTDIPITDLPIAALDAVAGAPLRSVDISSSPLRSVPLRSVPLRSVPLRSVPLRSVTLSDLPLQGTTWEAILGTLDPNPFAGVPLQSITLDAVLAADPPGLAAVSLADVDLGSTPLRSVSMASIALGSTPLRSVPLRSVSAPESTGTVFGDWCALLASLGYSCADLALTEDSPLLALDLAGVPLRSVPLRSVPLRSVDLSSAPLRSVPLRSVPLRSVAIGTIRLGDIVPMDAVVDCTMTDCAADRTLADAEADGAILATATLGTLFDAVDQDLLPGSLLDLLQAFIDATSYPWETLPVEEIGVQLYADPVRRLTYRASFEVNGVGEAPATATVLLPTGFHYVPGSGTIGDFALPDPTVGEDGSLTWDLGTVGPGSSPTFFFDAVPSLRLQDAATSTFTVALGETTASVAEQAPVTVYEQFESAPASEPDGPFLCEIECAAPAPRPALVPIIAPNTLVLSQIGSPGDVDLFRIPVPAAGSRLQILLGNQEDAGDYDVLLYNGATSTPLRSVPLRSVPLRSVPLNDQGVDVDAADSSQSAELLTDIPQIEGLPLRSVSDSRGSADELIDTVSNVEPDEGDYYTIQVTGYDGWSSNVGYSLFVKQYAPPAPPECPGPRTFAHAGAGVVGTAPASLPANLNTLFLVNQQRLGDTFGAAAAASVVAAAQSVADRGDLGVIGAVYPVDSDAAVAANLAAWDADPCSPEKANDAFRSIASVVDAVRADRPTLANIVVVGGDDIMPMARIADYTQLSNESDYAEGALAANGDANPIAAAVATQHFLSDDPLADVDPIPWLDHELYLPDLAVGRLVETPEAIVGQLQQFEAAGGVLDPTTALTTGYDFLTDGATAVDDGLAARIPASARETIVNETWSRADLEAALFPAGGSPDIASVNAHYDHSRALPAAGNTSGDESDLFTTDTVDAKVPQALAQRILFTMGCHAGLAVPNAYLGAGDDNATDWAETYLGDQQLAAVYFANTGFGYGDTAAVALSEELMRLFAERLDGSTSVGAAATWAKQAYFGSMGAYGPYDEKALQEATFYGLPMYRVGDGVATPAAAATVTPTPDEHGIASTPISITPTFERHTSPGGGVFHSVGGEVQVSHFRPIVPRTGLDVTPSADGLVAHGFLVTSMASHDELVVPAVARPVIDLTATEPAPPAGDIGFPTSFSNLTYYETPAGTRQNLVLLPGQVFRDASWEGSGSVTRLFDELGGEVKFSDSSDFRAPFLTATDTESVDGMLQIGVTIPDTDVVEVLAMVMDGDGVWVPVTLTPTTADPTRYEGATPVDTGEWELFIQALDENGNVGLTTNKGHYFLRESASNAPAPVIVPHSPRPTGTNGWYVSEPTVTVDGAEGTTVSVDGGAPAPYSGPIPIGEGVHSVRAEAPDGQTALLVLAVDTTTPAIDAAPDRPANAHGWHSSPVEVRFACTDGGSGIRTCGPDTTVSTETAGVDVAGTALDWAGNEASDAVPVKLDATPPTVAMTGVTNGGVYELGAVPALGCTASDALSGLDGDCTVTVTGGNPNGTGTFTARARARDLAGNESMSAVVYAVRYRFSDFLPPINNSGHGIGSNTSVFKAGSNVPVKFQLRNAQGHLVQANALPLWLTPLKISPVGAPVNETTPIEPPSSGTTFTWDGSKYQYNWKTQKSQAGWYWKIGVRLDDGSVHVTYIGLR